MKKHLTAPIVFFMLFALAATTTYAQTDFIKGYIVTTKNDTIKGFLKEKDLRENGKVVYKLKFTDSKTLSVKQSDYVKVQMGRISYDKITESEVSPASGQPFTSIRILKLEKNGYVKLYSDIHNHGGSATGAYGQYETFHLKIGNDPLIKINRIGFKALLKKQLAGMPDLETKVEHKDFGYGSIPVLIDEYNLWYFNK